MTALTKLCEILASGKEPTPEDYRSSFLEILAGQAEDPLITAFLTAQNQVPLSSAVLVAGVKALRQFARPVPQEIAALNAELIDTCGTGGDGKGSFNISTGAAFVAAGAGAKIAKHGNRSASSACGSADCLEAMGVPLELDDKSAVRALREIGFVFLFAPHYHPALKRLAPLRKALGVRTIFNLLGPLANPAAPKRQVLGVADVSHLEPMAMALQELGTQHAWLVHGGEGLDEISLSSPSTVIELNTGRLKQFQLAPADWGCLPAAPEALRGGNACDNARLLAGLLKGELADAPKRDVVLLNAAAALTVSGLAKDFKNALQMARESLNSGRAWECVERLRHL